MLRELNARARTRTLARAARARARPHSQPRRTQARDRGVARHARAARAPTSRSLAAQRRLTQQQISTLVAERARAAQTQRARDAALHRRRHRHRRARAHRGDRRAAPRRRPHDDGLRHRLLAPGTTATGLPVGWGVVAVDPSVIPLGTHMTIPGYGEAVAADTGGGDHRRHDRPLVPDDRAGERWGRRTVTIILH